MDEPEGQRGKLSADDPASVTSSLAEPINLEDHHYAQLQGDLENDSRGLEADSWSLSVDQSYLTSLNKEAIKRQEVIYELIQTEMHHVRTLKILLHVFMYELKRSLQVDDAWLERLFPSVEVLLGLHQHLLNSFKCRQSQNQDEENSRNFCMTQVEDILINQFSGNLGQQMMVGYGYFCSHHSEAVNFYKEQMQTNKKMQILIRKLDQLPTVRRLTIPECFLLVTQRITKYPVLLERIIQNSEADTNEFRGLEKALELIKDTISQVDTQVSESEKMARVREISYRLEPKAHTRLKDGRLFRKEDLLTGNRTLVHEGALIWKLSGKQKDVLAVLLSDMLLLLQEKDQKFVFASTELKPSMIILQGVIVREVAHEEKAMYIICVSNSGLAEMYELHASSKEECHTWMNLIREGVECYRDNLVYRERITKLQRYQDLLQEKDNQIKEALEEKQQIFATLYNDLVGHETPHKGLLLRADSSNLQQGETLLTEAIDEVEKLQNLFYMRIRRPDAPVDEEMETQQSVITRAETFKGSSDNLVANSLKYAVEKVERSPSSCEHLVQNMSIYDNLEASPDDESETPPEVQLDSTHSVLFQTPVFESVSSLAQKLYSLQAVIAQQDSRIELQKAFQSKPPLRSNKNLLLEQEKHRNLEKQKEELAKLHKQQAQHQAEQQRWEKEKETQQKLIEAQEAELKQRQEECSKTEAKLKETDSELKQRWEIYQQGLKRLRETTKKLDRDKEDIAQERERLEKIKSNDQTRSAALSYFQSFRSTLANGVGTLPQTSDALAFTGNCPDPAADTPPRVPPRRESISPQKLTKAKLPAQLISTTNQVQKTAEVQQKIPRKLATEHKGKSLTGKRSHKRAHSAANIDMEQVLPIRVTGKDGGSLRTQTITSSRRPLSSETFRPPRSAQKAKPSQSFITPRWNDIEPSDPLPPPPPPPFPTDLTISEQEKIIVL